MTIEVSHGHSLKAGRNSYAMALCSTNVLEMDDMDIRCMKHLSNNLRVPLAIRKILKRKVQEIKTDLKWK